MTNDVGFLELKYPSVEAPVRLFNSYPIPKSGEIFGYGSTGTAFSDVLRFVDVDIIASNAKYAQALGEVVNKSMFCAGGTTGKDACNGDSGGPLVVKDEAGEVAVLGIVSYGRGCGLAGIPGVYANLPEAESAFRALHVAAKWTSITTTIPIVGPTTPAPALVPLTPSPTRSIPGTNGTTFPAPTRVPTLSPQPAPSTQNPATKSPSGDNVTGTQTLVVPPELLPWTQSALVGFLIGTADNIDNRRIEDLLSHSQLSFESSANLDSLAAVVKKFDAKALHQRQARVFANVSGSELQC